MGAVLRLDIPQWAVNAGLRTAGAKRAGLAVPGIEDGLFVFPTLAFDGAIGALDAIRIDSALGLGTSVAVPNCYGAGLVPSTVALGKQVRTL